MDDDWTITTPVNGLPLAKASAYGRWDKKILQEYSVINRRNNLVVAPFEGRLG